ncbi:MAG: TonB family protein [Bdellovibrionales bacterium]
MKAMIVLVMAIGCWALVITLGASFFALDPSEIEKPYVEPPKPIAVQLPDPPKAEEPPPPPEQSQPTSALAELAPESFTNSLTDLGGVGFGSGGSGPAIAGGGGFGDAGNLMQQRTSVDRAPRAVVKRPPEYPLEARTRGVSGFVELRILVTVNGAIENIRVEKSEPQGFFDQAALSAVRQWRFEPGLKGGQAIAAWTTQRIKFELN